MFPLCVMYNACHNKATLLSTQALPTSRLLPNDHINIAPEESRGDKDFILGDI